MKKAIVLTLAIALTLSLAACAGGGTSQSDADRLQREFDRLQSELDRAVSDSDTPSRDDSPPTLEPTPEIKLPEIEENPVSDFEYKAITGGIEITKYIGTPVRVVIPANIEGLPVTSIGDYAFSQTGIMEVIIPESVTNIGNGAFSGNEALSIINIPSNVTSIGNRAFFDCAALTSISIPSSVTDIGVGVFVGCDAHVNVTIERVNKGGLLHFGGYFWRVLDVQGGEALIISEDILEERAYHGEHIGITWEHSDIRQYLNSGFYGSFSEADKARIIETSVINDDNPEYGTDGGNNTTDKIFLLSIDEANHYFADNSARVALNSSGRTSWWWLRSPGYNDDYYNYAADVNGDGSVNIRGDDVYLIGGGVRPALWINLEP